MELEDHLFRHEAGRMVSALTRVFGLHNLALAQDVVQEAFCRALEVWSVHGAPENPAAWLMATAKNRAFDLMRREKTARTFAPDVEWILQNESALEPIVEELLAPDAIKDDELRMMFSCCQPNLAEGVHVALILNVLCGFTVREIASAFVSSEAAIEKRISRGKKSLAASNRLFDVTSRQDFSARLASVQRALYLLFNEGYHGASAEATVRAELCREAMRLVTILLEPPCGGSPSPSTYALASLMHFHAARLATRVDAYGQLTMLFDQDRSRWDGQLIAEGFRLLDLSATGAELSEYHIESAIASMHAKAPTVEETDWSAIISLYEALMSLRPSPVIALNRAVAIAQRDGPARGIEEIQAIADREQLNAYPFYAAALGELELRNGNRAIARDHFREAIGIARNAMEREFFDRRMRSCELP
ncbi:MAG TPA: sigma-70 family RNA polymerase sigma factor [Steroidobacteraceae bacterium]|nr:sigma-70 family RNA polymerase sigma factor [Steroidobacteraceae bacterium]